jgi:DNA polymerase III delta prime subunit
MSIDSPGLFLDDYKKTEPESDLTVMNHKSLVLAFADEMPGIDYKSANSKKQANIIEEQISSIAYSLSVGFKPWLILLGERYSGKTYAIQSFSWACQHGMNSTAFLAGRKIYKIKEEVIVDGPESDAWNAFLVECHDVPGVILYTDNLSIVSDIVNSTIDVPVIIESDSHSLLIPKILEDSPWVIHKTKILPSHILNTQIDILTSVINDHKDFYLDKFGYLPSRTVLRRMIQIMAWKSNIYMFKLLDVLDMLAPFMASYGVQYGTDKSITVNYVMELVNKSYGVSIEDIKTIKCIPYEKEEEDTEGKTALTKKSSETDKSAEPGLISFTKKDLMTAITDKVIGQDEAVAHIVPSVIRRQAGLADQSKPIGSYLLAGPSGVGKTETAKAFAETVFGSMDHFIRIDCSELYDAHMVSRLLGSPQGYVGYESGGQLSNFVKKHPYSVILFDEIEKAHPSIYDSVLLQLLDAGHITSSKDGVIDCSNTLIFLTSNIGSDHVSDKGMSITGFNTTAQNNDELLNLETVSAIKKQFRVELINRFDDMIVYKPLDEDSLRKVFSIKWKPIQERLESKGLSVRLDDKVIDGIVSKMKVDKYGARNMLREMNRIIVDPLADMIVDHSDHKRFSVTLVDGDAKVVAERD